MASLDSYSPCPCGSGNKYKWCCHSVESVAEKAGRLYDNGQVDAALKVLDEGLSRAPGSPWLTLRKAYILIEEQRPNEAVAMVEELLRHNPAHPGGHSFLIRLKLQLEGPRAAVAGLQEALGAVSADQIQALSSTAEMLALFLGRVGLAPAARQHLKLALALAPAEDQASIRGMIENLGRLGKAPILLREELKLSPVPAGLSTVCSERFGKALKWAEEGRWAAAAAQFDLLAAEDVGMADRNLGICRFWMLDMSGAAQAFRRAWKRLGPTPEAVELEAICQTIDVDTDREMVEQVHLIWTLRDRERLLEALRSSDRAHEEGTEPLDEDDPDGIQVEVFALLDQSKPVLGDGQEPVLEKWPRLVGRALVGQEIAILETFDDGRLDGLSSWFCTLAGPALPPAQPRTKKIGEVPRDELALRVEFWAAEEAPTDLMTKLRDHASRVVKETIWPVTAMDWLDGKSPRQAAKEGGYEVPLRAALMRFRLVEEPSDTRPSLAIVRAELGLAEEPPIDPETAEVDKLLLSQLQLLDVDRLTDEQLVALYERAHEVSLLPVIYRAARVLVERPEAMERAGIDRTRPYADLALLSLTEEGPKVAHEWIVRGRAADPKARGHNAPVWDMLTLQVRSASEELPSWVPYLASVLECYRSIPEAFNQVMSHLLEMGLIELRPHPQQPERLVLDTRVLEVILTEYGPRVTTADGAIGVTAGKHIWTPESGGGTTAGGIWTPGSAQNAGSGEGRSKLIIPGS